MRCERPLAFFELNFDRMRLYVRWSTIKNSVEVVNRFCWLIDIPFSRHKMFNLVSKQTLNTAKNVVINPMILCRTSTNVTQIKNVKWERPKRLARYCERSGDIGVYVPPDSKNVCLQFQYATELEK